MMTSSWKKKRKRIDAKCMSHDETLWKY